MSRSAALRSVLGRLVHRSSDRASAHEKCENYRGTDKGSWHERVAKDHVSAVHSHMCRGQHGLARLHISAVWDKHKEQRAARQARATDDTHKLIGYLSSKDPFGNDPTLQSIDTGITVRDSVNADQAASVGRKILDGMVDKKVLDHTFQTLDMRSSVKTGKETVLMFQRLSTAGSQISCLRPTSQR